MLRPIRQKKSKYPKDFIESFWSNVKCGTKNSCWNWTRGTNGRYGVAHYKKGTTWKRIAAHRAAYEISRKRKIPSGHGYHGICICHTCDNPLCCNPKHLFLGTQIENIEDMTKKGRRATGNKCSNPGKQNGRAILDEKQVKEIRKLYSYGISQKNLGELFNVARTTIGYIVRKQTWTKGRST